MEQPPQLKPYSFKPGQSGNPSGRPKNPLKDYVRGKFATMTDKQKDAFLSEVDEFQRWQMAEGRPHQDINMADTTNTPSLTSLDEEDRAILDMIKQHVRSRINSQGET